MIVVEVLGKLSLMMDSLVSRYFKVGSVCPSLVVQSVIVLVDADCGLH